MELNYLPGPYHTSNPLTDLSDPSRLNATLLMNKNITIPRATSAQWRLHVPDVPSGGVFSVKTKTCLMWAGSNSTKVVVTTIVEWTGKSWVKGEFSLPYLKVIY